MLKNLILLTHFILGCTWISGQVITYNQDITAIYGSGNSDSHWTAVQFDNLQLGLRAKTRNVGPIVPQNNVYFTETGISSGSAAKWNFDFHIQVESAGADDILPLFNYFDFRLRLDIDPTSGTQFVSGSPLFDYVDNQYGFTSTPNGGKLYIGPFDFFTDYTVAQNSRNFGWDVPPTFFDANAPGEYTIQLQAFDPFSQSSDPLAQVEIEVVAVPEPSTVAFSTFAILGIVLFWRHRKRAKADCHG